MMSNFKWNLAIVVACFVQFTVSSGPVFNYHVFFIHLLDEFNESALFTGWIGSLCTSLHFSAAPLAIVIGSNLGNFRFVNVGILLASIGYLSTASIPTLNYGYLTYGILAGLGTCFSHFATGSLMLDWFSGEKNLCRYTGAVSIGSSFGGMVFGPLLNTLCDAYGWRNSFRILAGIVFVTGVTGALPFLKSRESHTKEEIDATSSSGPHDDTNNNEPNEITHGQTTGDSCPIEGDMTGTRSESIGCGTTLLLLRNFEVWMWLSSTTLAQIGWVFVIVNYSSFMEQIGLSTGQRSLALLVFGVADVGGKILFAVFGDRLPCLRLYVIALASIFGAIVSGFLTLSSTLPHMIVISVACNELFEVYGPHVVTAITLLGYGIGSSLGTLITGSLFDHTGDYTLSLIVLVVSFVISAVFMLMIPAARYCTVTWLAKDNSPADK